MTITSTLTAPAGSRTIRESPRPATSPPVIGPVPGQERIEAIDILRGVAILGILIVNMGLFSAPEDPPARELWPNAVDRAVDWLILLFAQEKFKTLFSFLFGLGLAVQMMRAEARGARFLPLYSRRLCVLFLIGTAHFLLLWDGDILHDYALLGFVLLLFRRRSLKTLLVWASVFLSIPALFYGLTTYYAINREVPPPLMTWISYETGYETVRDEGRGTRDAQAPAQPAARSPQPAEAEAQETTENPARIYSSGSYAEMVALRARQLSRDMSPDSDDAYVIGIFLLGLYAGRRRLFHDIATHRPLIQRVQTWGLLIGIAGNAAFVAGGSFDPSPTSVTENLGRMCLIVGAPALAFAYASTIALFAQRESWRRWLAPLAAVGRMALTNYLLQSLICTTIFYSYGLGLFGKVRPSLGLLLTIAIFFIQVPLSVWWLRRFRFGAIEWLWRSLTYWRLQPMRVSTPSAGRGTRDAGITNAPRAPRPASHQVHGAD